MLSRRQHFFIAENCDKIDRQSFDLYQIVIRVVLRQTELVFSWQQFY